MKKFIIIYIAIITITIIMILLNQNTQLLTWKTEEYYWLKTYSSHSDYVDFGVFDGFWYTSSISLRNCSIMFFSILLTTIATINKNNKIKAKWLILVAIIILQLFIPITFDITSGGEAGIFEVTSCRSIWNIIVQM